MQKYLQSLLTIRNQFELNGEQEVSDLITSAVSLLSNSSELPFDKLVDLNEAQIATQLNQLSDGQKITMVEALVVEKDDIVQRLLSATPNTIRKLALARAMEQIFNRVDLQ